MPGPTFDDLMQGNPMSLQAMQPQPTTNNVPMIPITGQTFNPNGAPFIRANPAGNITGCILSPGTVTGQQCVIANSSGNTIAFAAAATSFVDNGGGTIAAHRSASFIWDANLQLWSQNNSA